MEGHVQSIQYRYTQEHEWISASLCRVKEIRNKILWNIWFYFYKTLENANLHTALESRSLFPCGCLWKVGWITKEYKEFFIKRGEKFLLFWLLRLFHAHDIYQNLVIYCKYVKFPVCQLHMSKVAKKLLGG